MNFDGQICTHCGGAYLSCPHKARPVKDATDHEIQVMRARYTLLQEFGPLHERDRHPDDTKEAWFILDGHRIGWDIRRKTFEVILESEQ